MKKLSKRTIIPLFLFLMIFISLKPVEAQEVKLPEVIYETSDSQYLGPGIKYENIKKFTFNGWWNINVVRVDLTNQYAEIKGLLSKKGLSARDTVSNMVEDSNAIAGVNGDFFNYSPIPYPLGGFISEGKVISSPRESALALPSLYIDINNRANIDLFDRSMNITSLDSGKSVNIGAINKSTTYSMVVLLDRDWGAKSFGTEYRKYNDRDILEMVVVDDVVCEMRFNKEAVDIPENGYVISAIGSVIQPVLESFKVGDRVKVNINTTPNLNNIKFAIGGGRIILQNGQIIDTDKNVIKVPGNRPRTGIGISQDGNELIIATIDGSGSYVGVSEEVFGAIFKTLGAYNAINLDGGGSTTMAIKPLGEEEAKVVNKPSEGTERKVVNGIGVFSNAPKGELSYIEVYTDESKMFEDTTRSFFIKGFDEYHNPVEVDNSKVEFTFTGVDGKIDENKFIAKSSGTATIKATYEGLTDSIDVKVLGKVKSLIVSENKIYLNENGSKELGTVYGLNKDGYKAKIYPEDIDWKVLKDFGYIENGVFYSNGKKGTSAITLKLDNVVNKILVSVGSSKGEEIEGFEAIDNFKSIVYPDFVGGSIYLSSENKEGKKGIGLKYDFSNGEGTRASYLVFSPSGKDGLAIKGTPTKLSLWVKGDGNGEWLRGIVRDANGNRHYIDFVKNINFTEWQKVESIIPNNIAYPITLERIYVVETDNSRKYSGEIILDSLEAYYPPAFDETIGPNPTEFKDEKYVKENKGNKLSVFVARTPDSIEGLDAGLVKNINDKISKNANRNDLSIFIGKANAGFNSTIKSKSIINIGSPYIKHRYENVLIIDASSKNGGIRPTNPNQWRWLKGDLSNIQDKHVILFLNTPIYGSGGFKDTMEAELLHKTLVDTYESGKTVWVIYPGKTTSVELKDGVRYIQFNDTSKALKGIEFAIDGEDITYQIIDL